MSVEAPDRAVEVETSTWQEWLDAHSDPTVDRSAYAAVVRGIPDATFSDAVSRLARISWLARESRLDWRGFSAYELRRALEALPYQAESALDVIKRSVHLQSMPYRAYLRTVEWEDVRDFALRRAEGRCQLCSHTAYLQVHHRTYENRGDERLADVVVLCANCHARFHGKLP